MLYMKNSGTPLTLNRCNEECNLGVLFAANLKLSAHQTDYMHIKLIV